MKNIPRTLNLLLLLEKKSFFLFGPRGTGKSFLIRETLKDQVCYVNLLRTAVQMRLTSSPSELEDIIDLEKPACSYVVIDEVQKIPILLDEVHRLIEERGLTFLLTGSSARRLKAEGVNLLAGRAWVTNLYPLTSQEIGFEEFDLARYLRFGGLPAVFQSSYPEEQLDAYTQTYLNEEIKSEAVVRKVPAFVDFLKSAALSNGQVINFASFASDAGVSPPTIASYFKVLEDTLLVFQVEPWRKAKSRKAITKSKFYFFDTGVVNTLAGTEHVDRNSNLFGTLFEQWIAMELRAYIGYRRIKKSLQFWRTEDHYEVDFVIDELMAIEVKSTKKIHSSDLKSLKLLQADSPFQHYIVVSHDPVDRMTNGIQLLYWKSFITKLWSDDFIP